MRKIKLNIILLIPLVILTLSCKSAIYQIAYPTLLDGKYDSAFPYNSSSEQLKEITETTKRLNCIAYYKTYFYPRHAKVTLDNLRKNSLEYKATDEGGYNETTSGTATIISEHIGSVALLTCAHVVAFKDTVITYYKDKRGYVTEFIENLSIKILQKNYIPDFPRNGEVYIIALDAKKDLALLGRHYGDKFINQFDVFHYPTGSAKELDWGSFVYVVGYPMGFKMVSRGIVSSPNKNRNGSFLIDAVFNRGFSGGIVLAVRDGVPNFELVGLVYSVPAAKEYVLTGDEQNPNFEYNPITPYTGKIFLKKRSLIRYGITKVIPIELIRKFFSEKKDIITSMGFNPDYFFPGSKK